MQRRDFLKLAAALASGSLASVTRARAAQLVVEPIDTRIRRMAGEAPLRLQFTGGSAEACRRWQAEFSAQLQKLLGAYAPPTEWQTQTERTVEAEDHTRHELVLAADGHPPLPVHLLVPKAARGARAGILALHGHGIEGADPVVGKTETPGVEAVIKVFNSDYGRQLVRRGYVVAAPCFTPFGRRMGELGSYAGMDPCAITFARMQLLGKVLMAENLRDALWACELLARRAEVDAARLGCVGLSYGGRMAMLTAALEPRLRVAVMSGALTCMQERIEGRFSCGAQVIPGLLEYGDIPEIAALIAPRACLWEVGTKDTLINSVWADRALARMRPAWTAYNAADHLDVARFDGGHAWHGERAFALLDEVLREPRGA